MSLLTLMPLVAFVLLAFTADYPGLYDMFMEYDENKRMEAQKEYVQMYVKGHNLAIEYYKEYGSDPVKIFD